MKADIQDYIDHQRESLKKSAGEAAVFKSVVEATEVAIPQRMIDREIESLKNEYQQRLAYQGMDWKTFVDAQGGEEAFAKTLQEDAKARIKNSLSIDKIAKDEKSFRAVADKSTCGLISHTDAMKLLDIKPYLYWKHIKLWYPTYKGKHSRN